MWFFVKGRIRSTGCSSDRCDGVSFLNSHDNTVRSKTLWAGQTSLTDSLKFQGLLSNRCEDPLSALVTSVIAGAVSDSPLNSIYFVCLHGVGMQGWTWWSDNFGLPLPELWCLLKSIGQTFSKERDHAVFVADQFHANDQICNENAIGINSFLDWQNLTDLFWSSQRSSDCHIIRHRNSTKAPDWGQQWNFGHPGKVYDYHQRLNLH
jgi:hypothetical protein